MKTVTVHIKCLKCQKFDIKITININEHGYFVLPEAHCPECLFILEQIIDGEEEGCQKK